MLYPIGNYAMGEWNDLVSLFLNWDVAQVDEGGALLTILILDLVALVLESNITLDRSFI